MIDQIISHYKIISQIGQGGMGVVYKAKDIKLDRFVALKFLPRDLTRDTEAVKRFIQEARQASALDHPNICTIYEFSETEDGQSYIAMAYYSGETLRQKMDRGVLDTNDMTTIVGQLANGLTKAHKKRIVHRDIKPANIIFTADGTLKLLDFGLARLAGQERTTKKPSTLGTVAYMSPEQLAGHPNDHRVDIWSVGVIMYEMVTGLRSKRCKCMIRIRIPGRSSQKYRLPGSIRLFAGSAEKRTSSVVMTRVLERSLLWLKFTILIRQPGILLHRYPRRATTCGVVQ